MHKFNGITHGIYVAVRCTEVLVNLNAAHRTELDSGSIRKRGVRTHADGQYHHIGHQFTTIGKADLNLIPFSGKRGHRRIKIQTHPLLHQMLMNNLRHREVNRPHHLRSHLHYGYLRSSMAEILSHFKPYETTPYYDGTLYTAGCHTRLYHVSISHIAQSVYTLRINTRKRRHYRRCPGRQQQTVVALRVCRSVGGFHSNALILTIDSCDFRIDTHIDIEALPKRLRSLNQQLFTLSDHPAYVIRQSAVGV